MIPSLADCPPLCLGDYPGKEVIGTSLVVQWVRFRAPNAGGPGSSLVGEIDLACMPQLRVRVPQQRGPHATTKRSRMPQRRSRLLQLRPTAK